MQVIDAYFFYLQVTRQLLMNKLFFQIPTILQLSLFFNLIKLEDLDEVQIYNYLYLFKYFFGKRAYLSRVKSFFNVGKWTYSLKVHLNVFKFKETFRTLFFLINDIFFKSDIAYLNHGCFSKKFNIYYIKFFNLTIFTEKKTNLGLFFLKEPLNLHIFVTGCDATYLQMILLQLKFN